MNKLVRNTAVGLILATTANLSIAQCLNPHSWTWWDNTAYEEDLTSGPSVYPVTYTYAFTSAYPVYAATELDPGVGPNGEGKVTLSNYNYGAFFAEGWTRTWSDSLECTYMSAGHSYDGSYCNGSTYRATRAHIYMNDYFMASTNQTIRKLAMLHELGHVFGLGHVDDTCDSFMTEVVGYDANQYLTATEIAWINSTY